MDLLNTKLQSLEEQSIILPILQSVMSPISALKSIHNRNGDLVLARFFNQKLLFVSHPEHVDEVYTQEARGLLNRDFLYEAKKSLFGNGLVNSKEDIWAPQRRLMQPIFTKDAVVEWEKVFTKEAQGLTGVLKANVPGQINLTYHLKWLIQKIFIQVLMGRSVDTISHSAELIQSIDIISKGLLPQLVSQIISNGKLIRLMPRQNRKYLAAVKRLTDFINQEIAIKQKPIQHCLISVMSEVTDKKTGYAMTQDLLKDETINLFFAGQDTTLNTLAWFFYLIGRDEIVHKKITDEIRKDKDAPLSAAHIDSLTYTKAALYETLRLYPPSPALSTKAVEDIVISGCHIKKDTTVILSMYATHRHIDYWEKPNEFYPEHFLNMQAKAVRHKYAFFPFGGGLHNCIGRHFAELEMMVIIVALLREFTFKTFGDIKEASSITLKPNNDIIASLKLCSDTD